MDDSQQAERPPARAPEGFDRPWLSSYRAGHPSDIEMRWPNALAMFDDQVARAGELPLLHYFGTTMSLAEVDRLSDALSVALAEAGIGRGDRIALYLQNVPQFMIATLAAWKLAAVVVTVNPMLVERELRFQLQDSGARALVCLESLYADVAREAISGTVVEYVITTSELDFVADEQLPKVLAGVVRVATSERLDLVELCRHFDGQRLERPELGPADVALLSYTSGTTGPPKGAINTHGNVVFNSDAKRVWFCLDEGDVILTMAPFFHITGFIAHLTLAVAVPAPLVLTYRFEPETVGQLISRYRCSFSVGAITAYIALMNHPSFAAADLSSFAKVFSGGAPIAPSVAQRWERETGTRLHNAYGLSETSAASHSMPFGAEHRVDAASGALSVGVPMFNTVVRVLDDNGVELPAGEIGEFVTIGPQVVAGYWGKPEETEHAFRPEGFRTGDVGFRDADGWFYVVDRRKDMIISSGYKVWPREVEDVLYEHPAVLEAAVVGVADDYRGESVKAFVSLRAGSSVEPDELVAFCRERMAAYKRPREVEILAEIPKTITGKILRRELRRSPGTT